jgi:hypothetical protein
MFSAAFSSRSMTSLQDGQMWVRTDRLVATRCGQGLPSGIGQHPTAVLAGVRRRDRDHLTPGACCLGFQEGAQRRPAGSADARGEMAVAHQVADPQLFERDHVVLPQQRQRARVVEVPSLPLHLLVRALEEGNRFATARAALRAAPHAPLGSGELLFRLSGTGGDVRSPYRRR